jgi:phospholipase C
MEQWRDGWFCDIPPCYQRIPGEYLTVSAALDPTAEGSLGITSPIGLGSRMPVLVISPFSRGGFVSSDSFDHISVLRFFETRFGAEVPAIQEI